MIEIRTPRIVRGALPPTATALTLQWAELHREELPEDWELCVKMQTPKKDHAVGIGASVRWRVTMVEPLSDFRLHVRFANGTEGRVDLSQLLARPDVGVFAALRDPATFSRVHVHEGIVTWPGDIDLAPDAMYDEIRARGEWTLA